MKLSKKYYIYLNLQYGKDQNWHETPQDHVLQAMGICSRGQMARKKSQRQEMIEV